MSGNMFSASAYSMPQKPQRRLGRRNLALNNTLSNVTLNGTLNYTSKFTTEFPPVPSCASTPLADHSKNKENIYLSSIKPVLPSSPKTARKVPYQRRLGRRSMAATKTMQSEESLNNSVTRMKNINSSLRMTDPRTTASTRLSTRGCNKYLPASAPIVDVQPPSPVSSISDEYHTYHTKYSESYESVMTNRGQTEGKSPRLNSTSPDARHTSLLKYTQPIFESIAETSESPTITLVDGVENGGEKNSLTEVEEFTFLKKSLSGVHVSETTIRNSESHFGSFLGDMDDEGQKHGVDKNRTHIEMRDPENHAANDDTLNRTFDLPEEESFIFKTPMATKLLKHNDSTVPYKTPRNSVFRLFSLNDDANDSFVKNERNIMLEFNEDENDKLKSVEAESESLVGDTVEENAERNVCKLTLASEVVKTMVCDDVTSTVKQTLLDFVDVQQRQLDEFVSQQAKDMREFLDRQNDAFRKFIDSLNKVEAYRVS